MDELGMFRCQIEGGKLKTRAIRQELDLLVINQGTLKPLSAADVAIFRMDLCNDRVDRHFSRFPHRELETINSMIVGKPLMELHDIQGRQPVGRFFQSQVNRPNSSRGHSDEGAGWSVQPDSYVLRTPENANLIANIEAGVYRGTSIGFSFEHPECSICNTDLRECSHWPGDVYKGRKCHDIMHDVNDVFEGSIVPLGSQGTEFSEARSDGGLPLIGRGFTWADRNKALAAARLSKPTIQIETHSDSEQAIVDDLEELGSECFEMVQSIQTGQPVTAGILEKESVMNLQKAITANTGSLPGQTENALLIAKAKRITKERERDTTPAPYVAPPARQPHQASTISFSGRLEMPGLNPKRYASFKGANAERNAYKTGLWILANVYGREPDMANRPSIIEARAQINNYFPELRTLSTTVSTAGGVTVPQEFADAIIDRREQYGVYERLSNRMPLNNQSSFPRVSSDTMASFGGEGTEITETDPTFDNISLNAKSLRRLIKVSNELLNESTINIAEFLTKELGRSFAKRIDTIGFTANGETDNGGMTGANAKFLNDTTLAGYYQPGSCDNFTDVTTGMLAAFIGSLPEYAAQGEPFFITNRMGKENVFGRLSMAAGGVSKQETSIGTFDTYSGIPIAVSQVMPGGVGDFTNLDVMFLLGDLKMASFLGVGRNIEIQQSSERYFELNQTGFRGVMRCDSNVYDVGDATNAGSMVAFVSD